MVDLRIEQGSAAPGSTATSGGRQPENPTVTTPPDANLTPLHPEAPDENDPAASSGVVTTNQGLSGNATEVPDNQASVAVGLDYETDSDTAEQSKANDNNTAAIGLIGVGLAAILAAIGALAMGRCS